MFKKIAIIFCFLFVIGSVSYAAYSYKPKFDHENISVNNLNFDVEVASNRKQRAYGLMHRKELSDDYGGMLFIFDETSRVSMWMKNTYVPLDIIFISDDNKIIRIEKSTKPLSLKQIKSGGFVKYVWENKAGFVDKYNLKVGDRIEF